MPLFSAEEKKKKKASIVNLHLLNSIFGWDTCGTTLSVIYPYFWSHLLARITFRIYSVRPLMSVPSAKLRGVTSGVDGGVRECVCVCVEVGGGATRERLGLRDSRNSHV